MTENDWENSQSLSEAIIPDTDELFIDFSPSKVIFLPAEESLNGRSSCWEKDHKSRRRRRPIIRRYDVVLVVAAKDSLEGKRGASKIKESFRSTAGSERFSYGKELLFYRRQSVRPDQIVAENCSLIFDEKWEQMFLPHWDDVDADADLACSVRISMFKILVPRLFWVRSFSLCLCLL